MTLPLPPIIVAYLPINEGAAVEYALICQSFEARFSSPNEVSLLKMKAKTIIFILRDFYYFQILTNSKMFVNKTVFL